MKENILSRVGGLALIGRALAADLDRRGIHGAPAVMAPDAMRREQPEPLAGSPAAAAAARGFKAEALVFWVVWLAGLWSLAQCAWVFCRSA